MVTLVLSESEANLIELIHHVAYGEIFDVYVNADEPPQLEKDLLDGNAKLVNFIRAHGITFLPMITIHCQEAKQIEVSGSKFGFDYKKKIRL